MDPEYFDFIDGNVCYNFRCSMLHQWRTQHKGNQYSRIIFIEPNSTNIIKIHRCRIFDALLLDLETFCEDMIDAAEKWYDAAMKLPEIQENIEKSVNIYPTGIPPYIKGIPVIS